MSSMKDYIVTQLKEMGFNEQKIEKAIKATSGETLEQVMEWIITHEGETINESTDTQNVEATNEEASVNNEEEASVNNEEKAPDNEVEQMESDSQASKKEKTDEEKEQERRKYEELIKQRRLEREEKEKQEAIEKEKFRRKTGSEMIRIREELAQKEKIQLAQDLRKEKLEKEAHKRAILEQIRQDRESMKSRNLLDDKPQFDSTPKPVSTQVELPKAPIDSTSQCRIAIRLPNGENIQQQFSVTETLAAVRLFIQLNRKDSPTSTSFNLLIPPNKVFNEEDMEKSLSDLGLYPSARLTVSDRK